jgi:hypothetical protein
MAMRSIQVPIKDTDCPIKYNLKLRYLSDRKVSAKPAIAKQTQAFPKLSRAQITAKTALQHCKNLKTLQNQQLTLIYFFELKIYTYLCSPN